MSTDKKKFKLFIQPVPRSNWGDNLAHMLPKKIWDTLRRAVYKRANFRCELCGDVLKTLHCHESWFIDDKKFTQTLYSLISLCRECHNSIHWFRTEGEVKYNHLSPEYITELKEHFMKVNECTLKQLNSHLEWAMVKLHTRSKSKYSIDYGKYSVEKITTRYNQSVKIE